MQFLIQRTSLSLFCIGQNITLLDSPGVTEEEGEDAAARQIVHQCQNDVACGFIYVLNGTIAAEEGAQVTAEIYFRYLLVSC